MDMHTQQHLLLPSLSLSHLSHFVFLFMLNLFTLSLSLPSSCLSLCWCGRAAGGMVTGLGAAANPVLIETRVLIELSRSDRWRLAGRADCWSNSHMHTHKMKSRWISKFWDYLEVHEALKATLTETYCSVTYKEQGYCELFFSVFK